MKHRVKIVIGANYGDEGKGLMSRYFALRFLDDCRKTITVLHNGSAQRGHTADYLDGSRHVFHNFCAGAGDGAGTFYADSFLVHPMDFCREIRELGYVPDVYCDPKCVVVTPLDMLADQIIEDHIESKGKREYGSCCFGTWSATDRIKEGLAYTIKDFSEGGFADKMSHLRDYMYRRLLAFGVKPENVPQWKRYFDPDGDWYTILVLNFRHDVNVFLTYVDISEFGALWDKCDRFIFEGAQGLLLDKDAGGEWTTTSKTGLYNPLRLLDGKKDFDAEVCYVRRTYVTRHGDGPLAGECDKSEVGDIGIDKTNVFNSFQGGLRFAKDNKRTSDAICKDYEQASGMGNFIITSAATHCNEADPYDDCDYLSYSPYSERVVRS